METNIKSDTFSIFQRVFKTVTSENLLLQSDVIVGSRYVQSFYEIRRNISCTKIYKLSNSDKQNLTYN